VGKTSPTQGLEIEPEQATGDSPDRTVRDPIGDLDG
jgi:hypothetical protein